MMEEAYQLLGVAPEADGRTIEAAYWRRAKELKQVQQFKPEAAEELDRVNQAYEALISERQTSPRGRQPAKRGLLRRAVIAAVAAVVTGGALFAGLTYREEVRSAGIAGFDYSQEKWDETIVWLQSIDEEPADETPDSTSR